MQNNQSIRPSGSEPPLTRIEHGQGPNDQHIWDVKSENIRLICFVKDVRSKKKQCRFNNVNLNDDLGKHFCALSLATRIPQLGHATQNRNTGVLDEL